LPSTSMATTSRRELPWLYGGCQDLTSIELGIRLQLLGIFIDRDINGRWTETLTQDEVAEYEARGVKELVLEAARWLATEEKI
jgi:hypothetical protein